MTLGAESPNGVSFDGIALGEEAQALIREHNIDPRTANSTSNAESCELQMAKSVVSCVWHVATCKRDNPVIGACPEDDWCTTPDAKKRREKSHEQCEENQARHQRVEKWSNQAGHVILARQLVCDEDAVFRHVMNTYAQGVEDALRRTLRSGECRVLATAQLVAVVSKSSDDKLVRLQYVVPYANVISEGWAARQSLVTRAQWEERDQY